MSDDITSRRSFLKTGFGAGVGLLATQAVSATESAKLFRVKADGGGFAAYRVTTMGDIEQVGDGDQVNGNTVWGHVGPTRGTDTFRYEGSIIGLSLAGPGTPLVKKDGSWRHLEPTSYRQPSRAIRAAHFDSIDGTNTIRIEGGGGGPNVYEFEVSGSLQQRDDGDQINGARAWGHVGATRGVDVFDYTGDVTEFNFIGTGTVKHNGDILDPAQSPHYAVKFLDPHTAQVSGIWSHVGMRALFPTYNEYYSWGGMNGGPLRFDAPVEDGVRAVAGDIHLFKTQQAYQNQNPDAIVTNPYRDEGLHKLYTN